jgi:hypothetical protein
MSHLTRTVFHIVIIALAVSFAVKTAHAQDPLKVDPASYKLLYEDQDVRVLRYDDKPGHVVPKHTHQYPYRVYVITTATREFISVDDKTKECQKTGVEVKLVANDELVRPPTTHCEVNNGKDPTHLIIFEFKNQKTTAALQHLPHN